MIIIMTYSGNLLIHYVGVISTTFSCNGKDDSLYSLGWLNTEKPR